MANAELRRRLALGLVLLLGALGRPLAAQDSVVVINPDEAPPDSASLGLPPQVLTELLDTWNDSGTVRLPGGLTIPAGASLSGRVAAFRGTMRIGGEFRGTLTVINGDLVVEPGGVIHGDVLVAGGRFTVAPGGLHEGEQRVYWDAAPVQRQSDGELAVRERRRGFGEAATALKTFQTGDIRTTLRLTTTQTYNRIEGLGIVFGPAFEWRASDALTASLDARGILRTAPDPSPFRRDLGWLVRTDWRFHGSRGFGFGARTYSVIAGIEEHTLPRDEIGWNALLFQRDNRDYFSSEGVSGSAYNYFSRRFRMDASVRYEKQGSVRANNPWSLFRNEDTWRPNPLIDDGHYTSVGLSAEYDTRNDRDNPSSGWWIRGSVEHSWSHDVAPIGLPTTIRQPIPTNGYDFSRFTLDARRYYRLSPEAQLSLRIWSAGWLAGDPLPLQRRLSLGGPDLLPGYGFRDLNCAPPGYDDPSRAALCDRALITQGEFRHRLRLKAGYLVRDANHQEFSRFIGIQDPDLVVFGDAGSAWLSGSGPGRVPNNRLQSITQWKADAGVGIDAGGIAAYLVKALTDGEPVRFYLRLERRF
ncbi:MAG TPA: BamA/TamA family outer membrane protein [Gemmatimonadales bacterium]|nr:BamA/TamA family outer membrane protein [Gemmatimonadales bacterium]